MSYQTHNLAVLERYFTVVAKADGSPITAGSVNYYLRAKSGANAAKWWRNSDQTWQAAETANAMSHDADGHWSIALSGAPFSDSLRYLEYVREAGNLHIPDARHLVGAYEPNVDASNAIKLQSGTAAGQILLSSGQVTVGVNNDKSNMQVLPLVTSVQTEPVRPSPLVAYELGAITHHVAVFDAAGTAIDLSGKTLQFALETLTNGEIAFTDSVAVSGADDNVVEVTALAAWHAQPGLFRYAIRDIADGGRVWVHGEYTVHPAAGPH